MARAADKSEPNDGGSALRCREVNSPGGGCPVRCPVTLLKNIGWLLLGGALIPVFMALTLGAGLVILARHVYWWLRGNTTPTSRVVG
jgi:hypothetical protein